MSESVVWRGKPAHRGRPVRTGGLTARGILAAVGVDIRADIMLHASQYADEFGFDEAIRLGLRDWQKQIDDVAVVERRRGRPRQTFADATPRPYYDREVG